MPSDRSQHVLLMTGALHAGARPRPPPGSGGRSRRQVTTCCSCPPTCACRGCTRCSGSTLASGSPTSSRCSTWSRRVRRRAARPGDPRGGHPGSGQGTPRPARRDHERRTKPKDPGRLVAGPAMKAFLDHVRGLNYDYVLVDAPPLLGIADSQALARYVDEIVMVNRIDRMTLEHVERLREVLDRIDLRPLGIVVIGARGEISPYYPSAGPRSSRRTRRRRQADRLSQQHESRTVAKTRSLAASARSSRSSPPSSSSWRSPASWATRASATSCSPCPSPRC